MTYRSIRIEQGAPGYAAVNPNTNTIYISYPSSNFISVLNLVKGTIENKIQLSCPGNISVNDVTNKVYVCSAYGICEIDSVNNQYEMINIGLPHSDGSVDVNPLTNFIYTTCFGHDVLTVIDASSGAIADKIPVGKNPKGVAVDSTTNRIYVANNDSQSISVIDGDKSHRLPDIHIWYKHGKWKDGSTLNPRYIIVNESSSLLYVRVFIAQVSAYGGYEGQWLFVIDVDTGKEIKNKKIPSNGQVGFAYNHSSNSIYMSNRSKKAISKFDAYAKQVLHTTTLGETGFWKRMVDRFQFFAEVIAVNPSTNKVYVSDSKNNLLYEIDG